MNDPLPDVRRRYESPPLVEAVVEFQFEPGARGWDSLFFGKIHLELQEEFPDSETIAGAQLEFGAKNAISFSQLPEMKRFQRHDGGVVVTVGPNLVGFSVLPPKISGGHPGWEWVRAQAVELRDVYQKIVGPGGVRRLGVRYINAIPIEPGEFRLRDVLAEESGWVPDALLEEQNPFSYRLERTLVSAEEHSHTQVLQVVAGPFPNGARLMLDVDQVWNTPGHHVVETGEVESTLDRLHDAVHRVFETIIRDDILTSFGPLGP